jgi:hypothetical protein
MPGAASRSKVLAMNRVVDVLCSAKYKWRVEVGPNRSKQRPSVAFSYFETLYYRVLGTGVQSIPGWTSAQGLGERYWKSAIPPDSNYAGAFLIATRG